MPAKVRTPRTAMLTLRHHPAPPSCPQLAAQGMLATREWDAISLTSSPRYSRVANGVLVLAAMLEGFCIVLYSFILYRHRLERY